MGADEVFGYSGDNTIGEGTQFDAILDAWGMSSEAFDKAEFGKPRGKVLIKVNP